MVSALHCNMKSAANSDLQNQTKGPFEIINGDESMSLPSFATSIDIREAVQFLKRHADGITIVQAMDTFRKRVFDPRKVQAYEFWGIISRNGDRLKLTSLGWQLASRLDPEAEVYRAVLNRTAAYRAALEWIFEQRLELVTHLEIGAFWRKQHAEELAGDSEEELEGSAASFFHLCHAAEIGLLTVGRKGQPTRVHIFREELEACFNVDSSIDSERGHAEGSKEHSRIAPVNLRRTPVARMPRVFISYDRTPNALGPITEALELAGCEYELSKRNQGEAIVLGATLDAMRRCEAGIIAIEKVENHDANVGEDLQLGAALMHFEHRLVFLFKKGVRLPASLSELPSCEFEEELNWDLAAKVVKLVKEFTR